MIFRKTAIVAIFILTAGAACAQDVWLIPDFSARPGATLRIALHGGARFPKGDASLTEADVVRLQLHTARGTAEIAALRAAAGAVEAQAVAGEAGAQVIAAELKPRPVELSAREFSDYLAREGLQAVIDARARSKKEDVPGKMMQTWFAKSIVFAGEGPSDAAARPTGLKLEIVPLRSPDSARPGEKLALQVLFDGKPLGGAQIAAVTDGFAKETVPDEDFTFTTRTGYEGIAYVPLAAPGTWLVRLVHMTAAEAGRPHDWEGYGASLTFRIPPERGFPLTVESIMRGPDLVGYGIDSLRWSGDGGRLYFSWRRPGERKSHTYVLTRADGSLKRLTDEEARKVPPPAGDYSKDRRQVVFVEDGDIVLQDTVTDRRRTLMRTVEAESSPRFTADEKGVVYVRDNNLYRISLDDGAVVQLTDFRSGPRPPEPRPTDSQKFLEAQQKELFEAARERARERAEADERRKEREKRKPYYIPRGARVSGFELSPDQTFVVFTQTEPAERSKTAAVPNYVTDSGYTEDLAHGPGVRGNRRGGLDRSRPEGQGGESLEPPVVRGQRRRRGCRNIAGYQGSLAVPHRPENGQGRRYRSPARRRLGPRRIRQVPGRLDARRQERLFRRREGGLSSTLRGRDRRQRCAPADFRQVRGFRALAFQRQDALLFHLERSPPRRAAFLLDARIGRSAHPDHEHAGKPSRSAFAG